MIMSIRITSVQTQNEQEIPDGGSTPRRHLNFIGRVSPSGTVEIKDGRGGTVLGSAQAVEGDPFKVAVNAFMGDYRNVMNSHSATPTFGLFRTQFFCPVQNRCVWEASSQASPLPHLTALPGRAPVKCGSGLARDETRTATTSLKPRRRPHGR